MIFIFNQQRKEFWLNLLLPMLTTILVFGVALVFNYKRYGIDITENESLLISTLAIIFGFLSLITTLFTGKQSFLFARHRKVEVMNIQDPENIEQQINQKIKELRKRKPKRHVISIQVEYENNKIIIFHE